MKNLILTTVLFSIISFSYAQECGRSQLSTNLIERKINDSIYREGIEKQIEYFAYLNKEILPKYSDLKLRVLNTIDNEDLKDILELKARYENNRLEYLNEIKQTQERVYKNVTAYSKIYSVLVFETLEVFPDSYAVIFNSTIPNSRFKERDNVLKDRIYKKFHLILSEFNTCFNQMKSEMSSFKAQLGIVDIFQNHGNKTAEDFDKADLVDLLLWALK